MRRGRWRTGPLWNSALRRKIPLYVQRDFLFFFFISLSLPLIWPLFSFSFFFCAVVGDDGFRVSGPSASRRTFRPVVKTISSPTLPPPPARLSERHVPCTTFELRRWCRELPPPRLNAVINLIPIDSKRYGITSERRASRVREREREKGSRK